MSKEAVKPIAFQDIPEFSDEQIIFLGDFMLIHDIYDEKKGGLFYKLIRHSMGKDYDIVLRQEIQNIIGEVIGPVHTQRKMMEKYEIYRGLADSYFAEQQEVTKPPQL